MAGCGATDSVAAAWVTVCAAIVGAFGPSAGFFVAVGAEWLDAGALARSDDAAVLAAVGAFGEPVAFVPEFTAVVVGASEGAFTTLAPTLAGCCCLVAEEALMELNVVSAFRASDFGLACLRARSSAAGADFAVTLFDVVSFPVGPVFAGVRAVAFAEVRARPTLAESFKAPPADADLLDDLGEADPVEADLVGVDLLGMDLVEAALGADVFTDDVLLEEEVLARAVLVADGDLADEADLALPDSAVIPDVAFLPDLALLPDVTLFAAKAVREAALAAVAPFADAPDREEEDVRLVLAVADVGLVGMAHSFVGPGGDGPHGTRKEWMRT